MQVYVIIATRGDLSKRIESQFEDSDKCEITDAVWFVRSPRLSSSEVVADLGISADPESPSGIVVSSRSYDGAASRRIVQKLVAWEEGL